jgi:hypothetical protein
VKVAEESGKMTNEKYDCFLVKQKDGRLLKFCYDSQQGIYYQILMEHGWSERKSIYKESFEYFYVLEKCDRGIHVFCQDICGDLILCTLEGTEWKHKTLLHMKYDVITPIHIRAFFCYEDIHLLYNVVDKHTYSEVLVHQVVENEILLNSPQIIAKLDCYSRFPYGICQDYKSKAILLNTMLAGVYQLISRTFHINEGRWGKEEVIHTSLLPYIDFTLCVEENRKHYLFITQEDQVNRVIYQYKEIGLQKNTILFQHESINSCVLIFWNKVLWALWICEDKLYGCFSTNYGQNFSNPEIYRQFDKMLPVKALYQEYLTDEQRDYSINEIYVMNLNGEEQLFLQELLENPVTTEIYDNKNLNHKIENTSFEREELKDCFAKVEMLKREKKELQVKLKSTDAELRTLNEAMKYEKNQISNLQYKFYKEKEKINMYINENDILKEQNSFLEQKLLSKDKEKISIEKRLAEKEKENESLNQQISVMKVDNLSNSEEFKTKNENEISKEVRFSLIKWLFDGEDS